MTTFWNTFANLADDVNVISNRTLTRLQAKFWVVVLAGFAMIAVAWVINISGAKAFNFAIMAGFAFLFVVTTTGWKKLATAAAAGVALQVGAKEGIDWYIKTGGAILLYILLALGFLATWSFVEYPGTFWVVLIGVGLIGLLQWHFDKLEGDTVYNIAYPYIVIIIVIALINSQGYDPVGWVQEQVDRTFTAEEAEEQRPLTAEEQAALSEQIARDRANEARAREAEARARVEPRVTPGCTGPGAQYNVYRDCETVFFPTTAPYQRPSVSDGCLLAHDEVVTGRRIGTGTELFTPVEAGITVYFYVAEFGDYFRVNDKVCTTQGLQPRS